MNQSSQPRSFKYRPSLSITDGGSTHRYLKSSYSSHIAREDTHLLLKNQRPTSSSTSHHQLPYISTHHENTITSNTMNYATMNPPEEDPTFDSKKQGPKINIEVHDSATPSLSHRNRNINSSSALSSASIRASSWLFSPLFFFSPSLTAPQMTALQTSPHFATTY